MFVISRYLLLLTLLACFVEIAHASGTVDQVESLDVEKGESELELQGIFIPASNGNGWSGGGGVTLEHGVNDRLALGVELEVEGDGDETEVEAVSAQLKYVFLDPTDNVVGLGTQMSVGYAFGDKALATEAVLIADVVRKGWQASANLILESREDNRSNFDLGYAARADWEVSDKLALGIEAGGDLASAEKKAHWIGPVLAFETAKDGAFGIELGVFGGLNKATPDVQFRLEMDWAF